MSLKTLLGFAELHKMSILKHFYFHKTEILANFVSPIFWMHNWNKRLPIGRPLVILLKLDKVYADQMDKNNQTALNH